MLIADLSEESNIHKIVNESVEKFGKIDVLINNAGIGRQNNIRSPNLLQDYELIFNVNVKATILLTQLCVPYLIKSKGAIVNVASISSFKPGDVMLIYSMSKAALSMLTKNLAIDLGKDGVRVNEVKYKPKMTYLVNPSVIEIFNYDSPGHTVTHLYEEFGWSATEKQQLLDECRENVPIGKVNKPEDVAKAILFLASNTDAPTINGASLLIDGGLILSSVSHKTK